MKRFEQEARAIRGAREVVVEDEERKDPLRRPRRGGERGLVVEAQIPREEDDCVHVLSRVVREGDRPVP